MTATTSMINDDELLIRLRNPATRSRAFSQLVQTYGPRLHAHLLRMLHKRADADDVLQNAFVKVHRGIDGFRGDSQLYSWMYRITTNEALAWLRKRKRVLSLEAENEAQWVDRQLKAEPFFEGGEIMRLLHAAIATLPDKQREVFQLRYFEELPYRKISEMLQTSEGSLKASYHHAAKKIETFLRNGS
ncbi:MAG: sigma-70 family RNA polymerase sigma factor [Bacteroidota bacterium]